MRLNKKTLNDAKLYVILDTQVNSYKELLEIVKRSVAAGADIVQLRDKHGAAKDILEFCRAAQKIIGGRIPLILNDRVDLAMIASVDGVHLGQDDIPLKTARQMMGKRAIIGVSCQTMEHARRAQEEGADYIGFGSVFKTKTKPGRSPMDQKVLQQVVSRITIPVFAIGGITQQNVRQLRRLGISRVAVCREICESRQVAATVRGFKAILMDKS